MGFRLSKEERKEIFEETDEDESGDIESADFCQLCDTFRSLKTLTILVRISLKLLNGSQPLNVTVLRILQQCVPLRPLV